MFGSGTLTSLEFRRDYGVLRTYLPSRRRNLRMERWARWCGRGSLSSQPFERPFLAPPDWRVGVTTTILSHVL